MRGINQKLVVREQRFSSEHHRDTNAFYNEQFGGKPDTLTTNITYLLGDSAKMYPLTTMQGYSEMLGNSITKKVKDIQYDFPVMGRFDKAAEIAETPASLTPEDLGLGRSLFKLRFKDKWLKRYQIIESPNGVQCYVQDDPIAIGPNTWEYTVELAALPTTASLPPSEVVAGSLWIALFTPVSWERSRGSESNVVYPGKVKNQMSFIRKSMSWGSMQNLDRVMDFTIKQANGTPTNGWMSWFMFQFEKAWMEECEHYYWYARYNREAETGQVSLTSAFNGEVVPIGSGILEQIQNWSTYTELSYDFLQNMLTNAYFGMSDTDNMSITLYTGTGGRREFDRAMRQRGATVFDQLSLVAEADKFIEGSGYNLTLTGFFDAAYFIDGYYVKLKHAPIFDKGRMALKSPKHPVTGLPMESYRMVFIDDGNYDGNTNLQFIEHESMPFQHMVNLGFTDAPKDIQMMAQGSIAGASAPMRTSDLQEGSYHRGKSLGVQILRANKCLHLECVAR
jgi:hypothetical protein